MFTDTLKLATESSVLLDNTEKIIRVNKIKKEILTKIAEIEKKVSEFYKTVINGIVYKIQQMDFKDSFLLETIYRQIILIDSEHNDELEAQVVAILNFISQFEGINDRYLVIARDNLQDVTNELYDEIRECRELKDILKNYKTYEFYEESEKKHNKYYYIYLGVSIILSLGGLIGAWVILALQKEMIEKYSVSIYDYWAIKISFIIIMITMITFSLKQAIHHQKFKDQAEKTKLELQALPSYMFNFTVEQRNRVYSELTLKYFGREIDTTSYLEMNNIIQEQLRLSNELLKNSLNKSINK